MLFDDCQGQCPYCSETISIPLDPGGGQKQEIYVDCEVCCQPIFVRAQWEEDSGEYRLNLERS